MSLKLMTSALVLAFCFSAQAKQVDTHSQFNLKLCKEMRSDSASLVEETALQIDMQEQVYSACQIRGYWQVSTASLIWTLEKGPSGKFLCIKSSVVCGN